MNEFTLPSNQGVCVCVNFVSNHCRNDDDVGLKLATADEDCWIFSLVIGEKDADRVTVSEYC